MWLSSLPLNILNFLSKLIGIARVVNCFRAEIVGCVTLETDCSQSIVEFKRL